MVDYIRDTAWKSFSEKPFCEGDSLILSRLAYLDFSSFLEKAVEPTVGAAVAVGDMPKTGEKEWEEFKLALLASRRFAFLPVRRAVEHSDEQAEKQFAACTFTLPCGTQYIAFRGTDETAFGWKENFNMTFLPVVPAQQAALAYLQEEAAATTGSIMLGGHSKGGNLAVYAAACAKASVQNRLRGIYNHDGPGFQDSFYESSGYAAIESRIYTTIPEGSVVGRILCHDDDYHVVDGIGLGTAQHGSFHWGYTEEGLKYVERPTQSAVFLSKMLSEWIFSVEPKQREQFIDVLYSVVNRAGLQSLQDAKTRWLFSAYAALSEYQKLDEESRSCVEGLLQMLWQTAMESIKDTIPKQPSDSIESGKEETHETKHP